MVQQTDEGIDVEDAEADAAGGGGGGGVTADDDDDALVSSQSPPPSPQNETLDLSQRTDDDMSAHAAAAQLHTDDVTYAVAPTNVTHRAGRYRVNTNKKNVSKK